MKNWKYFILLLGILLSSCYEDYIHDFDYSTVGFAMQKPFRTVIADRDMEIRVGVSIGGKRVVDMNDWASFEIDSTIIPVGSGKKLLPKSYYILSDSAKMIVRKSNLPVADVSIHFTDAFFADPASILGTYVLPIRIINSSLDSITNPTTLVCFKYISTFQGTYYVKGKLYELNSPLGTPIDTITYENKDLISNITRDLSSIDRYTLIRPGVANFPIISNEKVQLKIISTNDPKKIYDIQVGSATGGIAISNGYGTYYGNKENPEMALQYSFVKDNKYYKVEESLILRQDPLYDLRVESW